MAHLFDSYQRLGEVTPGYEPWSSTTTHIVRQAIANLSRTGGTGEYFADIVHGSARGRRPHKIVTPSWASLLPQLVAAVLADALDLQECRRVAEARQELTELLQAARRWR